MAQADNSDDKTLLDRSVRVKEEHVCRLPRGILGLWMVSLSLVVHLQYERAKFSLEVGGSVPILDRELG